MVRKGAFFIILMALVSFPARAGISGEVLGWEDCVREAAKNHPDLISAHETVRQDEATRAVTASGEYPQVTASTSAKSAKTEGSSSRESYSAGVTGSQLLFDGKKTINTVKAASEDVKASRYGFRFTSAEVRQRLRKAFVGLMKAQELIQIAVDIYDIRRSNFELIMLRHQSGLEHRGALLQAEANLADARYGIIQARRGLEVAQRELAKEMGRVEWADLGAKGDFTVRDTGSKNVDLAALAERHPRVQKLNAQKNAAQFSLKAAYGEYAPVISVSGTAEKTGTNLPPDVGEASAEVSVEMPIFEGGLRKAKISRARAKVSQLEADARSARDSVQLDLEKARASLRDTMENVEVQRKALAAAEERSKIAQAQYSIGTISFDNWTIIEDNLVSAKRNFLNAEANALLSEADWFLAKGETLEYEK